MDLIVSDEKRVSDPDDVLSCESTTKRCTQSNGRRLGEVGVGVRAWKAALAHEGSYSEWSENSRFQGCIRRRLDPAGTASEVEGSMARFHRREAFMCPSVEMLGIVGPDALPGYGYADCPVPGERQHVSRRGAVVTMHGRVSEGRRDILAEGGRGLLRSRVV